MNCEEFEKVYWNNYILIENEFRETLEYVKLSQDNFKTYSNKYIKLILQIGSEIDIFFKIFCMYLDKNSNKSYDNMPERIKFVKNKYKLLLEQNVVIRSNNMEFNPWSEIVEFNGEGLSWWKSYNKIKHERNSEVNINGEKKVAYKFANLENTLHILGALYQILSNYYIIQAKKENKELFVPLPGSRMFVLSGNIWENVDFPIDHYVYVDSEMNLQYITSDI